MTRSEARAREASVSPDAPLSEKKVGSGDVAVRIAEQFGLLFVLVLEVIVFAILEPNTFATIANFQIIATSVSVLAVAAAALMLPLIGGRFDVSVGSNLALCSIAVSTLMSRFHLNVGLAIVIAALIGAALGAVNGTIVAYFGVNSIIATIGTSTVMGGIVEGYTGGTPIDNGLSPALTNLSAQYVFGVPALFLIAVAVCLLVWVLTSQTPYGRSLFATGSNLRSAQLNGLPVRHIVLLSFTFAGLLSGFAGVMEVAAQGSGDPTAGGLPFILPALAAVFLGATTLRPGRYNIAGTLLGLIFISTTISGLVLTGLQPWVTDVFNGSAVVIAIAFSAQLRRRRTGTMDLGT